MSIFAMCLYNQYLIKMKFSMLNRLACVSVLLFCLALPSTIRAQESMMPDVDYKLLDKLIQVAKTNYPRVQMYGHKLTAAEINVKRMRLAWFEVLSFNYLYSPNNSTTIVNPNLLNGYQIGVNLNLGNLLQKGPTVKMAREEMYVAQNDYSEYLLTLQALVKQRYFLYVQTLTMVRVRTKSTTDAETSLKDAKYKYEKGEVTLQEYNTVVTFMANQVSAKIDAEGAFLGAKAGLEELLGKTLEEIN